MNSATSQPTGGDGHHHDHQTVPSDQLLQTALAIAGQLAALPDSAYYPTKMSLWSHIPEQMEAAAVGAFLTDQARAHMSQFKG